VPRYELVDGKSNKFWEITLNGNSFSTTYGRIGTDGQTTLKEYDSPDKAQKEHDKLVASKVKKGYKQVGAGKAAPKKEPAKKATKAKAKKATKAKEPPAPAPAEVEVEEGWLRHELVEGTSSKFWEIKLEGKAVLTRYGRIGSEGKVTQKGFGNAIAAQKEHDKLVASKVKKGYRRVGGAPVAAAAQHAANPELEAALLANPDDDEAYAVYADWLQTQGDPRGELAAIQLQLTKDPKNKKLKSQETKLLEQHKAHLLGPLADFDDMLLDVEWHMGFIRKATVKNVYERSDLYDEPTRDPVAVEEVLGLLLDHPSARFLQDLTVGIVEFEDNGYGGVAKEIGKRHLPALRRLFLGDFIYEETELNWSSIGNAEPLYKGVPNLRSLTLRSGSMTLGKMSLPELRELVTITGGMSSDAVKSVCSASWPKLERLSLQLGRRYEGALTDIKGVRPILEGKGFPALKHLGITNAELTDDLCRELPGSKILPRLEELDLKMGTMSDDGAEALAAAADRLKHLKLLNVEDNFITLKGKKLLQGIGVGQLVFGEQRSDGGDPGDRYASAIE